MKTYSFEAFEGDTVEDLMLNLAHSEDDDVRLAVASDEQLPVAALWTLVNDPVTDVKLELLQNTGLSVAMLEQLSNDGDRRVARRSRILLRAMCQEHAGIATGNLTSDTNIVDNSAVEQESSDIHAA